ncbi:MAG: hypothetical protein AAFV95_04955 [Bacteroidota bacterium]
MKIRIKGNSLRLRLSQGDIAHLQLHQQVEDRIQFGPGLELVYGVEISGFATAIEAKMEDQRIRVIVPGEMAFTWCTTDLVGLENRQFISLEAGSLSILIEKDFQCLMPRAGENESDLFPNPNNQSMNL